MKRRLVDFLKALICTGVTFGCAAGVAYAAGPGWGAAALVVSALVLQWLVFDRLPNAAERRRLAGLCPSCGYDMRATPERCPECGAAGVG